MTKRYQFVLHTRDLKTWLVALKSCDPAARVGRTNELLKIIYKPHFFRLLGLLGFQ